MALWRGFLRGKKKRPKIGGKFLRWLEKFYLNIIFYLGGNYLASDQFIP